MGLHTKRYYYLKVKNLKNINNWGCVNKAKSGVINGECFVYNNPLFLLCLSYYY